MKELIFKDDNGQIITQGKAEILGTFEKEVLIEGEVIITEYFDNGQLFRVDHFNHMNKAHGEIEGQYSSDVQVLITDKVQNSGNYTKTLTTFYSNSQATRKSISIIDDNGNLIKMVDLDLSNEQEILGSAEKLFYENGELKYTFNYDDNGDFFSLVDYSQEEVDEWTHHALPSNFSWSGLTYYEKATPDFPTI